MTNEERKNKKQVKQRIKKNEGKKERERGRNLNILHRRNAEN